MPTPTPDLDLVKRPHSQTNYNEEQLLELIRCMDDPLHFMRAFMRVQHPLRGAIPFDPYPFQEEMIDAFEKNRFVINMTGRQMGKTVTSKTSVLAGDSKTEIAELIPHTPRQRVVRALENWLVALSRGA